MTSSVTGSCSILIWPLLAAGVAYACTNDSAGRSTDPFGASGQDGGTPDASEGNGSAGGARQAGGARGSGGTSASGGTGGLLASGGANASTGASGSSIEGGVDSGTLTTGCAVQISAGGAHTCARKKDGTVWCWGSGVWEPGDAGASEYSLLPIHVMSVGTVVDVVAGAGRTCVRKPDGSLWCWGENAAGMLGDGTFIARPSPVPIVLGAAATGVSLGSWFSCATGQDLSLSCWGLNRLGTVGNGTLTGTACGADVCQALPGPVAVLGKTVVEVAAGANHACARRTDGTVWCWGFNDFVELSVLAPPCGSISGRYCSPSPLEIPSLGNAVIQLAAGSYHSCAIKKDGTLWCWGDNTYGQLGDGTFAGQACGGMGVQAVCKPEPVRVDALGTTVVQVSAGSSNSSYGVTCAVTRDGTAWCWGDNSNGQIGDGTVNSAPSPVRVSGLPGRVAQISVGLDGHTCALLESGSVWCWGSNFGGMLGDGTSADRMTPVPVNLCP